jgi:hypothetical protein
MAVNAMGLAGADPASSAYSLSRRPGVDAHENCIKGGEFKLEDIVSVTRYLHGILVRLILKMIKYDGTYQPTVVTGTTMKPVDWVQQGIQTRELGCP